MEVGRLGVGCCSAQLRGPGSSASQGPTAYEAASISFASQGKAETSNLPGHFLGKVRRLRQQMKNSFGMLDVKGSLEVQPTMKIIVNPNLG